MSFKIEKAVRDLRWVLESPLLIRSTEAEGLQSILRNAVWDQLKRQPAVVYDQLPIFENGLPLGRWFEKILDSALRLTYGYDRVKKNLSDGSGGELDFLIVHDDQVTHVECSVKFFLNDGTSSDELAAFIGPAGRDRLDLKYRKMLDVQLGREVPKAFSKEKEIQRVLWMSGYAFYPVGRIIPLNFRTEESALSLRHLKGEWGRCADLFPTAADTGLLFVIPKAWWITRLDGFSEAVVQNFQQYKGQSDAPQMVAQLTISDGKINELARGFVI